MRVVLDVRKFEDYGIGRYVSALLDGLPVLAPAFGFELIALARGRQFESLRTRFPGWRLEHLEANNYTFREQMRLPIALRRCKADVFHAPHYATAAFAPCPSVVTVHDLIHVLFPELLPSVFARLYARVVLRLVVRRAAAVLCVSESTRNDLLARDLVAETLTVVTPNGLSPEPCSPAELPLECRNQPYVLFVGNPKPHKNLSRLLDAFGRLGDVALKLVIIGASLPAELQTQAKKLGGVQLGYVPDPLLWTLHRHARALVLPSLHEGFGLPALEAMSVGTPVVGSATGGLPALLGEAGLLVDPYDVDAIASAIRQITTDDELHARLAAAGLARAKQYRWEPTVRRTAEAYVRAASRATS